LIVVKNQVLPFSLDSFLVDYYTSACSISKIKMDDHNNNNQRQTINQEEDNLKYLPFNIQWLDSSYQQTCLPDSPLQKVNLILFEEFSFIVISFNHRFSMILNQL
jgi:hypothetical protein